MSPHPLPPDQPLRAHLRANLRDKGHGLDNDAMSLWAFKLDQLHEEDHEENQHLLSHGRSSVVGEEFDARLRDPDWRLNQ